MKTQYIEHLKKWSAFTTINGLDIFELGDTKQEALDKLKERIANSDFLLEGVKLPKP